MKRKGRQTDLGPALDSILRRLDRGTRGAYTSARVIQAWEAVAGGMALAHTTGAHVREGVLTVYVDGNTWATQLAAMGEQYRSAVNGEIGQELISAVKFTVSRKVADEHKLRRVEADTVDFYRADETEAVALTPSELAQVEASVGEIPDEELREAVLKATVKDLEWKKGISAANGRQRPPQSF